MEMLMAAAMFSVSVSLLLFYFASAWTEKKMIEKRIRLLQESEPAVMAREQVYNLDFTHHKRAERASEIKPAVATGILVWLALGGFILHRKGVDLSGILLFLVILPLLLQRIVKRLLKRSREERFKRELPGALDLMVVCLEAGLAVNSALLRIANEMEASPLGRELRRTADEVTAGLPLEDALKAFAKRTQIEDVNTIVSAIIQAEKMGTSLAVTFRVQAETMREKYKMVVRERINRVPIKILFPLVFFLFPALFVVILGPSMIHIMETLKSVS